jgi:hypothetical protein
VLRTAKVAWAATAEVGFWRRTTAGGPAGAVVPVAAPPASEPTRPEGAPARASATPPHVTRPADLATTLVPGEERKEGGDGPT